MRKYHSSVQYGVVNEVECSEIIFQSVADNDGVGVDKSHQIILNFFQIFAMPGA